MTEMERLKAENKQLEDLVGAMQTAITETAKAQAAAFQETADVAQLVGRILTAYRVFTQWVRKSETAPEPIREVAAYVLTEDTELELDEETRRVGAEIRRGIDDPVQIITDAFERGK